jgi:hypothetical protein
MHRTARQVIQLIAKAHPCRSKEAWLGAGTETADRGVGKVTPPFQTWGRGVLRTIAVSSKKCSGPVFHCSVGWPTGDSRGGRDLATEGSLLVECSGAQWGRPGEAPIGPINVQGESRSQIRRWVASAMKWEAKYGEGRPTASSRYVVGLYSALHS